MIAAVAFPGQGPVALPVIPPDREDHYVFAVVAISTGEILYTGPSLWSAAGKLRRGACYASAWEDEGIASSLARQIAQWFRDQDREAARREAADGARRPETDAPDRTPAAATEIP